MAKSPKTHFPITSPRYSAAWADEVLTNSLLRAGEKLAALERQKVIDQLLEDALKGGK